MFYQNHSLALHAITIFCNLILRNNWICSWKILDYLTGLGLTLWYIGIGLKKYMSYYRGIGLISLYIRVKQKKYSDYFTEFGLISWYIGLGLKKQLD